MDASLPSFGDFLWDYTHFWLRVFEQHCRVVDTAFGWFRTVNWNIPLVDVGKLIEFNMGFCVQQKVSSWQAAELVGEIISWGNMWRMERGIQGWAIQVHCSASSKDSKSTLSMRPMPSSHRTEHITYRTTHGLTKWKGHELAEELSLNNCSTEKVVYRNSTFMRRRVTGCWCGKVGWGCSGAWQVQGTGGGCHNMYISKNT